MRNIQTSNQKMMNLQNLSRPEKFNQDRQPKPGLDCRHFNSTIEHDDL